MTVPTSAIRSTTCQVEFDVEQQSLRILQLGLIQLYLLLQIAQHLFSHFVFLVNCRPTTNMRQEPGHTNTNLVVLVDRFSGMRTLGVTPQQSAGWCAPGVRSGFTRAQHERSICIALLR